MTRLYFDLETIPDQSEDALVRAMENVKVPASYKKAEVIDAYRIEHARENWEKTSLAGITGEICSIAFAFDDGPVESITRKLDAPGERELLLAFFSKVKKYRLNGEGSHQRLEWIGHNVIDFDLRFVKHRTLILNLDAGIHIPADGRHNKGSVFDTMREWCGWKGFVKQSALQQAFAIPADGSLECMGGHQVAEFWAAGRYKEIAKYNQDDVRVCREIHQRLVGSELVIGGISE